MAVRLAVIVLALSAACGGPALAQTHVREPLSEFLQDPDKLTSLLRGVAVMKSRDGAPKDSAEYRTSWEYWAAIHGYPGPQTGTIEDWQEFLAANDPVLAPALSGFFAGLENATPPDTLAEEVWATCEHGTMHFFTWHRMYLYFFERVLRAAAEDPNFALPYWDYTSVGTPGSEPWRLPGLFTVPELDAGGTPVPNPLFEPRRTPGFGRLVQLDSAATDIDGALLLEDFEEFQSSIDGGVHAYVHCSAGNACLAPRMGIVPFAAGDPIFWHHHANVDRMWSCWLAQHGTDGLPAADSDWMKQTYAFVDENGARVEMSVAELFNPNGRIDYVYQGADAVACFRQPPTVVAGTQVAQNAAAQGSLEEAPRSETGAEAFPASAGPSGLVLAREVSLAAMLTTIAAIPAAGAAATGAPAAEAGVALGSGRAILRLRRVVAQAQPGAAIAVELARAGTGERRRVGTIAFFALSQVGPGSGHAHGAAAGRDYAFDVTDALRELGAASLGDVSVELRAESLVPPTAAAAAASESQATSPMDPGAVAAALRRLDTDAARELLAQSEAPAAASEAARPEPSAAAAAAAEERFRRADITVGEVVLNLGR
jgi:hypothetical protein